MLSSFFFCSATTSNTARNEHTRTHAYTHCLSLTHTHTNTKVLQANTSCFASNLLLLCCCVAAPNDHTHAHTHSPLSLPLLLHLPMMIIAIITVTTHSWYQPWMSHELYIWLCPGLWMSHELSISMSHESRTVHINDNSLCSLSRQCATRMDPCSTMPTSSAFSGGVCTLHRNLKFYQTSPISALLPFINRALYILD